MKDSILIRADGNSNIGLGHIMRCMSIGIAARKQGVDVAFVVSDKSCIEVLKNNHFKVHVLNSSYERMDEEIDSFVSVILKEGSHKILLDSYYITNSYINALKKYAKIIYIDDIMSFPYPVDVLINYNVYAKERQYEDLYSASVLPKIFIGCKYTPLRKEFQMGKSIKIKERIKSIFVSTGGADPERVALRFIDRVVSNKQFEENVFHIVLGKFEPDRNEIEQISVIHNNIVVHNNVKNMSDLMLQCDIAISAAGSTLYELCSVGVPTITYILADNQAYGAEAFAKKGIMINAGDNRKKIDLIENIMDSIKNLTYENRAKMQRRMQRCISGNGAAMIAKEIIRLE